MSTGFAPLLADMVQQLQDKEHGRKTMDYYTKDDPLDNLQLTNHSTCSTYFDKATAKLIQEGKESFIYEMFAYTRTYGLLSDYACKDISVSD